MGQSICDNYIDVAAFIYSATIMIKFNKEQSVECSGKNDLHRVVIYSSYNTS